MGGGGGWWRTSHYISMGRDVLTKEILFSASVWNGGVFQCKDQIYLSETGFMKGGGKLP